MQKNIFWRVINWFFPSFNEMNIITILAISVTLLSLEGDFYELLDRSIVLFIFIPLFVLLIGGFIFLNEKMDNGLKEFLAVIYYLFIAVLAGVSLAHRGISFDGQPLIEIFNTVLMLILFVSALIRCIFAWFLNDGKHTKMDDVIWGSDQQFTYIALALAAGLSVASVLILNIFYESTATIAILTFGYIGILQRLLEPIIKPYIIQK